MSDIPMDVPGDTLGQQTTPNYIQQGSDGSIPGPVNQPDNFPMDVPGDTIGQRTTPNYIQQAPDGSLPPPQNQPDNFPMDVPGDTQGQYTTPNYIDLRPTVQGVAQIKQAVAAGYSYQDVVDHHEALGVPAPARPPLADIYAGVSISAYGERGVGASTDGSGDAISKSTYPTLEDLSRPGRDKINEGAGPIGEVVLGAGAGGVAGALKGAISTGVLGDVAGSVEGRIASMGITTGTEEAAAAQPLANPETVATVKKVARRMLGTAVGSAVAGDKSLKKDLFSGR